MNSRDRDQLLILFFIVAFIGLVAFFYWGSKVVPVELIVCGIVLLKFLYIQPSVTRFYYNAHGRNVGLTRFIPVYNEIIILPESSAKALLISYVIIGICVALLFVPSNLIAIVVGEHIALNYGINIIRFIAVALIANVIIYGLAMCKLMQNIEKLYRTFTNSDSIKIFNLAYKFLLFIPVIRVVALLEIYNRLHVLVKLNKFDSNKFQKAELREE